MSKLLEFSAEESMGLKTAKHVIFNSRAHFQLR